MLRDYYGLLPRSFSQIFSYLTDVVTLQTLFPAVTATLVHHLCYQSVEAKDTSLVTLFMARGRRAAVRYYSVATQAHILALLSRDHAYSRHIHGFTH